MTLRRLRAENLRNGVEHWPGGAARHRLTRGAWRPCGHAGCERRRCHRAQYESKSYGAQRSAVDTRGGCGRKLARLWARGRALQRRWSACRYNGLPARFPTGRGCKLRYPPNHALRLAKVGNQPCESFIFRLKTAGSKGLGSPLFSPSIKA
jgi:hypothetical protein